MKKILKNLFVNKFILLKQVKDKFQKIKKNILKGIIHLIHIKRIMTINIISTINLTCMKEINIITKTNPFNKKEMLDSQGHNFHPISISIQ